MKWTAYFRCIEASSKPEALKIAMSIRPGNWIIDKLEPQKENN